MKVLVDYLQLIIEEVLVPYVVDRHSEWKEEEPKRPYVLLRRTNAV